MDSIGAYRMLLRLFPGDYRDAFEAEMLDAFARTVDERRKFGRFDCGRFLCAELAGLALHVPLEWIAKATTGRAIRARVFEQYMSPQPAHVHETGLRLGSAYDEIAETEKQIEFYLRRMEHAIATHDFPGARYYSNEDLKAREHLRILKARFGLAE